MSKPLRETDLYPPIKIFLESQGYEVKSEIGSCDVMAVRGDEPPLIVELKTAFNLPLLLQGIDRQRVTDSVYLAIPLPRKGISTAELSLCKRLGLGLLCVNEKWVEPYLDPQEFVPRKQPKRRTALLKEFRLRKGDPNSGGSSKRPLVTSYRQDALRCLAYLKQNGATQVKDVVAATQVARAPAIFRSNVYGWFTKVERGVFDLAPEAQAAARLYADVIATLD